MSSDSPKLRQRQDARISHDHQLGISQAQSAAKEFASVEDLLRFDSEQNPVPPEVSERLNQSLRAESKPPRPWYRRIFGG